MSEIGTEIFSAAKAVETPDVDAALYEPQKFKERFGATLPQVLEEFGDRLPAIVKNIEKDTASGITPERAVENALDSLKRDRELSIGLNDQQVERYFRPDIEEAAAIVGNRQTGIISPKETVIPLARENSGFATDPGRDSRYSMRPQKNQDAVGNYKGYIIYDVSPQERIAAARSGKPIQSAMEVKPLHLTPEDLANKGRIYVLSDGAGGDAMPGDIASNFVVQNTLLNYYSPNFKPDLTDPVVRMKAVLDEVNSKLVRETNGESGGTLNAVVVRGGKVWVFNVGDSRTYRVDRNGETTLLTTDQSWGNKMVAEGKRTPEEVKRNPNARQLWSYMGGVGEHFKIDVHQLIAHPGEKYVQISDGLLEVLSEKEIANIVNKARSPQEAAQSLIRAANDRGAFLDGRTSIVGRRDNISAQVIEILGEKKWIF